MKSRINYIVALFALTLGVTLTFTITVKASTEGVGYVKKLGSGINLGNTFETGLEEVVLDKESMATIVSNIKSQGFKSIRIPITWQGHWEEGTTNIEEEYLERIKELVDIASDKDMYVILTMYDDSWRWISDTRDTEATLKKYQSLWKQIATYFKEYGEKVSFEAVNAPIFKNKSTKEQQELVNKYNKSFVKTVRKTGGKNEKRYLMLPLLNGQVNEENCKSMQSFYKKLKDKRVIVTVQYYGLWNFSVNAAGTTTFNQDASDHMVDFFKNIETHFTKKNIPVVCGEYGLYGYPIYEDAVNRGERLKFFYQFVTRAKSAKLSYILWDTGVIYNRTADQWIDEDLKYIIKFAKRNEYSYCGKDAIYLIKGKEKKDVTLSVSTGISSIHHLRYNDKEMEKDKDYVVSENKITIKKSFLVSIKPKVNGLTGTLEVVFKNGPTWKINVYQTQQPVLTSSGSRGEEWKIPMEEAGDSVASMEAFTEDKKSVGPLDWTTYQEYGYCFIPDYNQHSITLTKEFLASLPEKKEITLRFHFRSGQEVDYVIIKEDKGVREVSYDWDDGTGENKEPVFSEEPESKPLEDEEKDLKNLVEKENQKAVRKQEVEAFAGEKGKKETVRIHTVGWKLLFVCFSIMVILGMAILYIYHAHRREEKKRRLAETEDGLDRKIHKILVDKTYKDA